MPPTDDPARLAATEIDALPGRARRVDIRSKGYEYLFTTGPFQLPAGAGSLDWVVLNNDSSTQKVRVTVFRCNIGSAKTALPPGPLEVTVDPDETTHNANTYDPGFIYEVQVETSSLEVFPYASVWPGNVGVIVPGTGIPAASFIQRMH